MSNIKFGPKIIPLGEDESVASIERWRQNVLYHLRLNEEFRPYLIDGTVFGRKSKIHPDRSLIDDVKTEKVGDNNVTTVVVSKQEKCFIVDLMLDQIANFCQHIPRNDITRDSGSLKEVWEKIRMYHNLEKSGALLNDTFNIKRKPEESPQALFARLKQSFDDNLLSQGGLTHVDGPLTEDEELSPTMYNSIILLWLQLLHPQLRDSVTQRFSTQLRDKTYGALFPEISKSVGVLLDELNSEATTNRVFTGQPYRSRPAGNMRGTYRSSQHQHQFTKKCCEYCKLTGKKAYYTHNIDSCLWIKRENMKASSAAKQVDCSEEDIHLQEQYDEFYKLTGEVLDQETDRVVEHQISAINTSASPVLILNKDKKEYKFTLDTGCTGNIVDEDTAISLGAPIKPTLQRARTADGKLMDIIGETEVTLFRESKPYHLRSLVCADKTDLLAGMPFLKLNDIAVRPATDQIIIDGKEFISYDPVRKPKQNKANRVSQFMVQAQCRQVILPGESITVPVYGVSDDESVVIEPRWDSHCNQHATKDSELWPVPQVVTVSDSAVCLSNNTDEPITVRKAEHFCQIQPQMEVDMKGLQSISSPSKISSPVKSSDFSTTVTVNPESVLSIPEERSFKDLLKTYDTVFSPVSSTYNGKLGPCFVEVNMGESLPPQRKGRVPFYSRDNLQLLQEKFDELERRNVFSRPQEVGVSIENINPSFLVNKQASSDKRLVTDFSSISEYCRPTPSLLPDVDTTLRNIGIWKYIIKTDMSSAYYQLPVKKSSKKFLGVHTPYRGLRVYNVGCMGLPGVEVALEELTCLLVGDLVKEGKVAKLADDMFIGGETPEELLKNFEVVLYRLLESNIKLSPSKTIIAPKSVSVLGWIWTSGQLRASPHRISSLSTCKPPETVSGLKSFIGAYRFLSRVLSGYAKLLMPLENSIRGRTGKDKMIWSTDLQESFLKAQHALLTAKTITVPTPTDTLWIVTDAALRPSAIGATLYAVRDGKPHLAGFFNAKLPDFQTRWLPCEVEGLAVATALNHYAPLIIQSHERPQVLTDSKACVQAVQKLRRGGFSASARLTTFLSSVSRFNAEIQHIAGAVNLPSDHASRHPLICTSPESCQVDKFINDAAESVVNEISVSDVVDGKVQLPFTNRAAWKEVQSECPELRRVLSHKKSGTMPNKKSRNLRIVRKYLSSNIVIASDGLLVHRLVKPLDTSEQIVVPDQVIVGFLTALHLKLKHPTAYQLSKAFSRYFFALNLERLIAEVTKSCYHCASIKDVPKALIKQSTSEPPVSVGSKYVADIIKRSKQKIFIMRETTTSFTLAEHIQDETAKEVGSVIIKLTNVLKPSKLCPITIKVDPAPAHKSMLLRLSQGSELAKNNINLELGRELNVNKNPIIDKAIRELNREILNVKPTVGPITTVQLSEAIACLNSRLRSSGLSSYELWTQRDQVSGEQLPIVDRELILAQHKRRSDNHPFSEKSKAGGKSSRSTPNLAIGTLVYVYSDGGKTEARKRYMVTGFSEGGLIKIRRFTSKLFSSKVYEVTGDNVYKVPEFYHGDLPNRQDDDSSDDEMFESYTETESEAIDKNKQKENRDNNRDPNSDSESMHTTNEEELTSGEEGEVTPGDEILPNLHTAQNTPPRPPAVLVRPDNTDGVRILRQRKHINYSEDN